MFSVGFEYERIRKHCFHFQCLTHDKTRFSCNPVNRHLIVTGGLKNVPGVVIPNISEDDPLFGVLTDGDVGIDAKTGRPKISKAVLDEVRKYLSIQDASEKQARVLRVRKSVWELNDDSACQKVSSVWRLLQLSCRMFIKTKESCMISSHV